MAARAGALAREGGSADAEVRAGALAEREGVSAAAVVAREEPASVAEAEGWASTER